MTQRRQRTLLFRLYAFAVIELVLIVRLSRAAWISRSGFRERRWARQKDQLRDRVIADEHERTRHWN